MKKDNKNMEYIDQKRVFVSYNRDDEKNENNDDIKTIISQLNDLDKNKWKIIIDKKVLEAGDNYNDDLKRYIETSHVVVILISEKSEMKGYANQEIGYTIAKKIPIFPISIDGTSSSYMISNNQVFNFSNDDENKISEISLSKRAKSYSNNFNWQFVENQTYFGNILTKTLYFISKNGLANNDIRIKSSLNTLEQLFSIRSIKTFITERLKANVSLKILILKREEISLEKTVGEIGLIEFLLELKIKHTEYVKISFCDSDISIEDFLIYGNLVLIKSTNVFTNYAPFISSKIIQFEEDFYSLSNEDENLVLNNIKTNLKARPKLLKQEVCVELRDNYTEKELSFLDREIRNAKELRLFVTTINSFVNRLKNELRSGNIFLNIFGKLKTLKIYIYSFDVIRKFPPGKPIHEIESEWRNNIYYIIEMFSQIDNIDFDLVILNTIPTFTGIYASCDKNKVFKITPLIYGSEPAMIPQFIGWSDEFYHSIVMDKFENLIKDFDKKNRPQIRLPITRIDNNWKRFLSKDNEEWRIQIKDFIKDLEYLSNELPNNKHNKYLLKVKYSTSISNVEDIGKLYCKEEYKINGFYSIDWNNNNWELSIDKNNVNIYDIDKEHIISVFAIIQNPEENKILLIKKRKESVPWEYDVIGGKMLKEDNQLLIKTLKREILEEIGLIINEKNLERLYIKYDSDSLKEKTPVIPIYYRYKLTPFDKEYLNIIKEDTKGNDLEWVEINWILQTRDEICHIPKGALLKIFKVGLNNDFDYK